MIAEINLGGVYLSSYVVIALAAFAVTAVLRKLLGLSGLYRRIWHPALFDAALFILVWTGLTFLPLGILSWIK